MRVNLECNWDELRVMDMPDDMTVKQFVAMLEKFKNVTFDISESDYDPDYIFNKDGSIEMTQYGKEDCKYDEYDGKCEHKEVITDNDNTQE